MKPRRLIGSHAAAYAAGRVDARAGRRAPWRDQPQSFFRTAYVCGWEDETARMRKERRLPQTELAL